MRIRATVAGLLAVAALAGCTSSGHGQSAYCVRLKAAAGRLTNAETDLYRGGSGSHAALRRIVSELEGLQAGEPNEIKSELAGLISAFRTAEQLLKHPSGQAEAQLNRVASRLATDGKNISDYVTSRCT